MKASELLPDYLKEDQRWVDLCDAIDYAWSLKVNQGKHSLKHVRHTHVLTTLGAAKRTNRQLLAPTDYELPDLDLAIKQSNLLGMRLSNPEGVLPELLPNLIRNVGSFWYSKGLPDFAAFIAYVFNTPVQMHNLWTEDYINFVKEGEQGTPIWNGGTWYPTTHVLIYYNEDIQHPLPIQAMINVWLDISNYNLVLHGVGGDTFISVADANDPLAVYPTVAELDYGLVCALEEDIYVPFY